VREYVAILYRGANYELGRGVRFYGIWPAGRPQPQPIEWWPESPEGWAGAWARFTRVEPGAITPVGPGAGQVPPPPAPPPWNAPGPGATVPAPPVPVQTGPGQAAPGQSAPGQTVAGQTGLGQTGPGQAATGQTVPGQPAAGQTVPGQTAPGQTVPGYGPVSGYGPQAGHAPGFAAPRGYGQPPPPRRGSQRLPSGSRARALTAAGLLAAGVVLGIVGLFTNYLGGSIASQPDQLVQHAFYLAAWTASALLIATGPARQRIGALLGLGTSVVTFGLLAADLATALSAHRPASGMWPTLLGWLLATAGAAAGYHRAAAGAPAKLRAQETGPLLMLLLAGLGTAAAFAPAWDKFTITASNGTSQTITAGNAFANPGLVIAADVLVMAALVAVVVVAALWRPARLGAALLAGATIPMAAQAISALVQLGEASPAQQVGLSPSQASAAGLTVTAGPTPVFWVYCIFVGALIACCAWLLLAPAQDLARPAPAWPVPPGATRPAADDRTPAMAGAPATAGAIATASAPTVASAPTLADAPATASESTLADAPAQAPASSATLTGASSAAGTMAAPATSATSQAPATPSAPSASPHQESGRSSAGDLSVKPGDSPADPSGSQETRTSDGYSTDPARPADPAS
jgi:hypothetical protein